MTAADVVADDGPLGATPLDPVAEDGDAGDDEDDGSDGEGALEPPEAESEDVWRLLGAPVESVNAASPLVL